MGTSFSQRQSQLLTSHFARVTLLLDGDEPGRRAAEIIAQLLLPNMPVDTVALPKDVQPDQLSSAEINFLLARTTILPD
jgi:DNA primase